MKAHAWLSPGGYSLAILFALALGLPAGAQLAYQQPPKEVLDILRAPPTALVSLSPTRDRLLLVEPEGYPTIAEVAQPMLGLGGLRINPRNNGPHRVTLYTGVTVQTVPGGEQVKVKLPQEARLAFPLWSPDGKQFAFAMYQATRIELWVVEARTGKARKLNGVTLNDTYGSPFQWMPDNRSLLCRTVPEGRGPVPVAAATPPGPNVQESDGKKSPARTYEDLLKDAHDDELFEHYVTSQILLVDAASGSKKKVGKPALYSAVDSAPDGQHLLVSVLKRPYSRLLTVSGFARDVMVIDRQGITQYKLASLPSHEGVPLNGVLPGPRSYSWRPTAPATLVWVEAARRTNSTQRLNYRDRLMALAAPFKDAPTELMRLEHRYAGTTWLEKDGMAMVSDNNSDKRWRRTFLVNMDKQGETNRLVWEFSTRDRYKNPGDAMMKTLPSGDRVVWQSGPYIYLSGTGASPRGDYPFLDRFNLATFQTERLFHCDDISYEYVVALVDDAPGGVRFITRHETTTSPPNYRLRTAGSPPAPPLVLTHFADPMPQLRQVSKQLVTYKRDDGVTLSFTLYLPPNYQPGKPLPTMVWAYPLEYNDAETAGQVSGSTNRFTTIRGASHLFFLTQGYAILDNATMPIVGPSKTMNDTFVQQILASSKAAIDKAVEMGVTDRNRVGVGGHSYGAFMTANLLAHSDLFRAGIARSGAYNRTLTPFGFQGERRTLWEAQETYAKMSPFMFANKINEPILLVHGEMDDNAGTFPIQSERLFHAIKGHGGTARYVTLPNEAHGYAAKESIEHTLWEMITWFDKHVKNAKPVEAKPVVN